MRKLIMLLVMLVVCLPSHGAVLIYKYRETSTDFNFDSGDGGWEQQKGRNEGYSVIDSNSGRVVMVEYSRRRKNFQVLADDNRTFTKVVMKKKNVWVITDFWSGGGLWVFGNAKTRKIGNVKMPVAAKLKGNIIFDQGDDPRSMGWSQLTLRLNSNLTKEAVGVHFTVDEAITMVVGRLRKKGYVEYVNFAEDSDIITNPWLGLTNVGDSYTLAGYGSFYGATRTYSLVSSESVRGVNCLILRINGYGQTPVVEYYDFHIAQDTSGNIHILKVTGIDAQGNSASWEAESVEGSPVYLPVNSQIGQKFPFINDGWHEVIVLNWTIPQMSTGAGPYVGCMLYRQHNNKGDTNELWLSPGIGIVKEAWGEYGQGGWERIPD